MPYEGPALGEKGSEQDIDTANRWMRSQPWYQEFLKANGQDPNRVRLSENQRRQLGALMAQNGLPVPEKDEVDPAGNINPKGHKLRNFLTAAAIGGAALTGFGLAGMGPLAGIGGGAAGGAGAAGGVGAASGGAGAASLATPALTAGLPTGLSAGSLSTAALAGSVPGVAGVAGMAEPLLTAGLPGGLEAGSLPASTLTGAAPSGGGLMSQIGKYAKQIGGIGEGINSATNQAAQNRMAQNDPYMQRARLDDTERSSALRELYGINATMNPTSSPFNPRPREAPTGSMADTLKAVAGQHERRLQTPGTYNATTLPSLQAGTMEKVGNWVGPTLSTVGKFLK